MTEPSPEHTLDLVESVLRDAVESFHDLGFRNSTPLPDASLADLGTNLYEIVEGLLDTIQRSQREYEMHRVLQEAIVAGKIHRRTS